MVLTKIFYAWFTVSKAFDECSDRIIYILFPLVQIIQKPSYNILNKKMLALNATREKLFTTYCTE